MNAKTNAVRRFQLRSLEQLRIGIVVHWNDLSGRRFHLSLPKSSITVTTLDDILNHEDDDPLEIIHDKLKGFSKFTFDDTIQYAKLPLISLAHMGVTKQSHFFESVEKLNEEILEKEIQYLLTDLRRRIKCLDMDQSVEHTMRELISPILIGAIMLSADKHLKINCVQNIEGELGKGPVDYVISYKSINIVVTETTETKKHTMELGMAQIIAQQVANREERARKMSKMPGMKRKYDDILSDIATVPAYGIVTTGDQWLFFQCNGNIVIKSEKLTLDIQEGEMHEDRRKKDLDVLLRWIVGIIKTHMTIVNNFSAILSVN